MRANGLAGDQRRIELGRAGNRGDLGRDPGHRGREQLPIRSGRQVGLRLGRAAGLDGDPALGGAGSGQRRANRGLFHRLLVDRTHRARGHGQHRQHQQQPRLGPPGPQLAQDQVHRPIRPTADAGTKAANTLARYPKRQPVVLRPGPAA